jgi:hypothetical protein
LSRLKLPKAKPRRRLGLPPPAKITGGPPLPADVLTAKAESFAFRRGRGEGALRLRHLSKRGGGRYVTAAGKTATARRSASTAVAAALKALKAADATKRAERRAKRKKPPSTPVEGDSQ